MANDCATLPSAAAFSTPVADSPVARAMAAKPGLSRSVPRVTIPAGFPVQVSHQTQEPPFESLPAEPGIQQGASRRSRGR